MTVDRAGRWPRGLVLVPALGFGLGLGLHPSALNAQPVEGGLWRPDPSLEPDALPVVEGTLLPGPGQWNAGFVTEYVRSPWVGEDRSGGRRVLVRDQAWVVPMVQLGVGRHFAVGFQAPLLVYQGGGEQPVARAGLGDLRAVARWSSRTEDDPAGARPTQEAVQAQRARREGFGVTVALAVTAPTAEPGSVLGAGAPTVQVFSVLDFRLARLLGALSLGYRARIDGHFPAQSGGCPAGGTVACLGDVAQRDAITWGVVVRGPLEGLLALVFLGVRPEWSGAAILAGSYGSTYLTVGGAVDARALFSGATPVELGFGWQLPLGDFTLTAGSAFGVVNAPGVGAVRATAGMQWAPRFVDEDRDGFRDDPAVDHCIGLPEDFDGFEDDDGCPEDNDHDAVPDEEDRCPTVDEDEDGFQDEDGCPDPDNDDDGVNEPEDQCPDTPMGPHPDPSRAGCPDPDPDQDGVNDPEDRCPEVTQGPHPDPDRPGCPLPDRDRDGVPDTTDRCPDAPAGDGAPPEALGCPDLDRDHDGVEDSVDRCPDAPETLNGTDDTDGCPESPVAPGARVRIVRGRPEEPGTLELLATILFDARDQVLPASRATVAQLALGLRATARPGWRWHELSVPTSPQNSTLPPTLRVTEARADRRRDAVLALLRALGATEVVVRPAASVPWAGARGVVNRGVLLSVRETR